MQKFIDFWKEKQFRSATAVMQDNGWYYSLDGEPLNIIDSKMADTKTSQKVYKVTHAFHLYEKERFFKTGKMWENVKNDPYLYEIPVEESYDIDREDEFIMCEALYTQKNRQ